MRHSFIKNLLFALVVSAAGVAASQAQEEGDEAQSAPPPTVEQYAAVLKDLSGLETYNELVERQIQNQEAELQQLQASIEQVPDLERQIPPLLTRMVDALGEFIELDLPFKLDERRDRVAALKTLIENTDVSDAEKARRVLEAWTIEGEYGRTYDAVNMPLEIDGTVRPEVQVLRIGRVGMVYQTPDLEYTGAWDPRQHEWVELGSSYRNQVREALRMARNQVAPQIVMLPMTPPGAGTAQQ